jgi:hypothetical protein
MVVLDPGWPLLSPARRLMWENIPPLLLLNLGYSGHIMPSYQLAEMKKEKGGGSIFPPAAHNCLYFVVSTGIHVFGT